MTAKREIAQTPVLVQVPNGWMAVTDRETNDYPRIGVIADTADAARSEWETSRDWWVALRDMAAADPVSSDVRAALEVKP